MKLNGWKVVPVYNGSAMQPCAPEILWPDLWVEERK